ncbi:MAG: hypothetical protein GKR94_34335 [Gammaproteobacteria bacterium]|nr:hypothetical protein [Gammaproteobacteria bacterium]
MKEAYERLVGLFIELKAAAPLARYCCCLPWRLRALRADALEILQVALLTGAAFTLLVVQIEEPRVDVPGLHLGGVIHRCAPSCPAGARSILSQAPRWRVPGEAAPQTDEDRRHELHPQFGTGAAVGMFRPLVRIFR